MIVVIVAVIIFVAIVVIVVVLVLMCFLVVLEWMKSSRISGTKQHIQNWSAACHREMAMELQTKIGHHFLNTRKSRKRKNKRRKSPDPGGDSHGGTELQPAKKGTPRPPRVGKWWEKWRRLEQTSGYSNGQWVFRQAFCGDMSMRILWDTNFIGWDICLHIYIHVHMYVYVLYIYCTYMCG